MLLETIIHKTINLAAANLSIDEIPIAACIFSLKTKEIIALCANQTKQNKSPLHHAEILAINEACATLGENHLHEYAMFVTIEPCLMCAMALSHAQLGTLYYGAYNPKEGAVVHGLRIFEQDLPLYKPEIYGGFGENACAELMTQFFQSKRNA